MTVTGKEPDPGPGPAMEPLTVTRPAHDPRREAIRKDIAQRLRKSCSNLSEEAFAALVEKILGVQIAGETKSH
jgi:hypothetical protein